MKTERSHHEPGDVVLAAWQEQVEQAQEKPWLAALLLQQGQRILRRFAYFYERLRALPRNTRRTIQKKLATTLAGAALLLALSGTSSVHAAGITVTPGSSDIAADGRCSLVEAIVNANDDAATHGDCAAGSGADVITLAGNTYSYTSSFGTVANLPDITSQITIEANSATIQRNMGGTTIRVESTGNLTLNNATLTGASGDHRAIYANHGTVTINNCTITGSGGPAVYNYNGNVTINSSTISGNSGIRAGMGVYNAAVNGYSAIVTINNSTIANNTSTSNVGGGIANGFDPLAVVNLNQTIVSGNSSASGGTDIYNYSGIVNTNNYNLIGDSSHTNAQSFSGFTPGVSDITATSDGTNPTSISSILNTTLANNSPNGDPNTPNYPDTHALVSGSPAVDVIPPGSTGCNADGSSVDQRGGARANTTYGSGVYCDIGAYEYGATASPTAITIEGLTARNAEKAGPVALGAAGVLALLTGGWLARARRRRA